MLRLVRIQGAVLADLAFRGVAGIDHFRNLCVVMTVVSYLPAKVRNLVWLLYSSRPPCLLISVSDM